MHKQGYRKSSEKCQKILTYCTFRLGSIGSVSEVLLRALGPRQLSLEALREVEQAPGDDGVVVQRHVKRHHRRTDANPTQIRRHLVPHTYGAFPQTLPDRQLQVKYRKVSLLSHDSLSTPPPSGFAPPRSSTELALLVGVSEERLLGLVSSKASLVAPYMTCVRWDGWPFSIVTRRPRSSFISILSMERCAYRSRELCRLIKCAVFAIFRYCYYTSN
ncbi:hypothetical protein SFRURICE_016410 [Spodoptera frugiperda]|nr:hypothetical protein SFRURICE_012606 [Spodoptera frugiperda]KAF9823785.1 hypothetical protein SFRURICE_016410 [Spodoptera frugiperda]